MAFTSDQINEIKKQLIQQIQNSFPEDKKQESIERINSMNESEIMQLLEQNNAIKNSSGESEKQECIFCSIVSGEIPSTKLAENAEAIAILELNPLSEGHTIIIPKNHDDKSSEGIKELIEKTKALIQNSLKPKSILVEPSSLFGHGIINLVPVYGEAVEKERKKSNPEELKKVKEKILKENEKKENPESKKSEEKPKPEKTNEKSEDIKIIPKRIP